MLINRYRDRLVTFCSRYLGSDSDGEDVAQEVCVLLYEKLDSFKENSQFSTWLYRIAVNTSINCIKKRNRINKLKDLIPFIKSPSEPDEEIIRNQEMNSLKKGIDRLSKKQKTVFILRMQAINVL